MVTFVSLRDGLACLSVCMMGWLGRAWGKGIVSGGPVPALFGVCGCWIEVGLGSLVCTTSIPSRHARPS